VRFDHNDRRCLIIERHETRESPLGFERDTISEDDSATITRDPASGEIQVPETWRLRLRGYGKPNGWTSRQYDSRMLYVMASGHTDRVRYRGDDRASWRAVVEMPRHVAQSLENDTRECLFYANAALIHENRNYPVAVGFLNMRKEYVSISAPRASIADSQYPWGMTSISVQYNRTTNVTTLRFRAAVDAAQHNDVKLHTHRYAGPPDFEMP